jgi:hypothetical protein
MRRTGERGTVIGALAPGQKASALLQGVPTFLPPKIPAKDLWGWCCSRSSPLSVDHVCVDHVFIEGISASETGHLHDFGNRVVLGSIEFFGACHI